MMPKIYIAGRITGMEAEAKVIFDLAEALLNEKGYIAINPMKLPHNHDKEWHSYMKECIKALCDCDVIYLLSNWRQSKGARVELTIAIDLNLEIIYQ